MGVEPKCEPEEATVEGKSGVEPGAKLWMKPEWRLEGVRLEREPEGTVGTEPRRIAE